MYWSCEFFVPNLGVSDCVIYKGVVKYGCVFYIGVYTTLPDGLVDGTDVTDCISVWVLCIVTDCIYICVDVVYCY
jgi:hypothetical protein